MWRGSICVAIALILSHADRCTQGVTKIICPGDKVANQSRVGLRESVLLRTKREQNQLSLARVRKSTARRPHPSRPMRTRWRALGRRRFRRRDSRSNRISIPRLGCCWHGCPKHQPDKWFCEKTLVRDQAVQDPGFDLVVMWNVICPKPPNIS